MIASYASSILPVMGGPDNPEKRRIRQRRYWLLKGWARRRERELRLERDALIKRLRELDKEARDLGLS